MEQNGNSSQGRVMKFLQGWTNFFGGQSSSQSKDSVSAESLLKTRIYTNDELRKIDLQDMNTILVDRWAKETSEKARRTIQGNPKIIDRTMPLPDVRWSGGRFTSWVLGKEIKDSDGVTKDHLQQLKETYHIELPASYEHFIDKQRCNEAMGIIYRDGEVQEPRICKVGGFDEMGEGGSFRLQVTSLNTLGDTIGPKRYINIKDFWSQVRLGNFHIIADKELSAMQKHAVTVRKGGDYFKQVIESLSKSGGHGMLSKDDRVSFHLDGSNYSIAAKRWEITNMEIVDSDNFHEVEPVLSLYSDEFRMNGKDVHVDIGATNAYKFLGQLQGLNNKYFYRAGDIIILAEAMDIVYGREDLPAGHHFDQLDKMFFSNECLSFDRNFSLGGHKIKGFTVNDSGTVTADFQEEGIPSRYLDNSEKDKLCQVMSKSNWDLVANGYYPRTDGTIFLTMEGRKVKEIMDEYSGEEKVSEMSDAINRRISMNPLFQSAYKLLNDRLPLIAPKVGDEYDLDFTFQGTKVSFDGTQKEVQKVKGDIITHTSEGYFIHDSRGKSLSANIDDLSMNDRDSLYRGLMYQMIKSNLLQTDMSKLPYFISINDNPNNLKSVVIDSLKLSASYGVDGGTITNIEVGGTITDRNGHSTKLEDDPRHLFALSGKGLTDLYNKSEEWSRDYPVKELQVGNGENILEAPSEELKESNSSDRAIAKVKALPQEDGAISSREEKSKQDVQGSLQSVEKSLERVRKILSGTDLWKWKMPFAVDNKLDGNERIVVEHVNSRGVGDKRQVWFSGHTESERDDGMLVGRFTPDLTLILSPYGAHEIEREAEKFVEIQKEVELRVKEETEKLRNNLPGQAPLNSQSRSQHALKINHHVQSIPSSEGTKQAREDGIPRESAYSNILKTRVLNTIISRLSTILHKDGDSLRFLRDYTVNIPGLDDYAIGITRKGDTFMVDSLSPDISGIKSSIPLSDLVYDNDRMFAVRMRRIVSNPSNYDVILKDAMEKPVSADDLENKKENTNEEGEQKDAPALDTQKKPDEGAKQEDKESLGDDVRKSQYVVYKDTYDKIVHRLQELIPEAGDSISLAPGSRNDVLGSFSNEFGSHDYIESIGHDKFGFAVKIHYQDSAASPDGEVEWKDTEVRLETLKDKTIALNEMEIGLDKPLGDSGLVFRSEKSERQKKAVLDTRKEALLSRLNELVPKYGDSIDFKILSEHPRIHFNDKSMPSRICDYPVTNIARKTGDGDIHVWYINDDPSKPVDTNLSSVLESAYEEANIESLEKALSDTERYYISHKGNKTSAEVTENKSKMSQLVALLEQHIPSVGDSLVFDTNSTTPLIFYNNGSVNHISSIEHQEPGYLVNYISDAEYEGKNLTRDVSHKENLESLMEDGTLLDSLSQAISKGIEESSIKVVPFDAPENEPAEDAAYAPEVINEQPSWNREDSQVVKNVMEALGNLLPNKGDRMVFGDVLIENSGDGYSFGGIHRQQTKNVGEDGSGISTSPMEDVYFGWSDKEDDYKKLLNGLTAPEEAGKIEVYRSPEPDIENVDQSKLVIGRWHTPEFVKTEAWRKYGKLLSDRMNLQNTYDIPWISVKTTQPRDIEGNEYEGLTSFMLALDTETRGYKIPVYIDVETAKEKGISINGDAIPFPVFDSDGEVKDVYNIESTNLDVVMPEENKRLLDNNQALQQEAVEADREQTYSRELNTLVSNGQWTSSVVFDREPGVVRYLDGSIHLAPFDSFSLDRKDDFYRDLAVGMSTSVNKGGSGVEKWDYSTDRTLVANLGAAMVSQKYSFEAINSERNHFWRNNLRKDPVYVREMLRSAENVSRTIFNRIEEVERQDQEDGLDQSNSFDNSGDDSEDDKEEDKDDSKNHVINMKIH